MATTDILQVDTEDIITELNGFEELNLPRIGEGSFTEEKVLNYAKRAEATVLSRIPEMYRAMTREVRGEMVVEVAYSGQDTFQLGLFPVVEGSLDLYVDYGQSSGGDSVVFSTLPAFNVLGAGTDGLTPYGTGGNTPYGFRTYADRLATDKFSVDWATGEVTLLGDYKLGAGQKVYADYKHTGMGNCHNLVDMTIRLAAGRLGQTIASIPELWQQLQQMQDNVMVELQDLMDGRAGIDLLDNIKLVDETRQGARSPYRQRTGLFW